MANTQEVDDKLARGQLHRLVRLLVLQGECVEVGDDADGMPRMVVAADSREHLSAAPNMLFQRVTVVPGQWVRPMDVIRAFVEEVEHRAEEKMLKTGKLEGAHYAAMKQLCDELSRPNENKISDSGRSGA